VMHRGEVQQFADPDTVYNRPANLFVARFMGSPPMNTIQAVLSRDNDGIAAVIGDPGARQIRLKLPTCPAAAAAFIDRPLILGIRPECITEADERDIGGPFLVAVDAEVDMVEPTGAETMVMLRLGGHEAVGRVSPDLRLTPGLPARFSIDTRKACLFDPTTELLIA
jgi:multiple sugar transport system ATP-binding protein